jgi:hypothetical protein
MDLVQPSGNRESIKSNRLALNVLKRWAAETLMHFVTSLSDMAPLDILPPIAKQAADLWPLSAPIKLRRASAVSAEFPFADLPPPEFPQAQTGV